ncbi:MAG TPA: hypothetical protein VFB63_02585 [Bryobacteraceae bacterium]|nr:hypothetical protein [Bryobacteraceae bacterium]
MGYDLTFRSRGSGAAPPIEDLHEYFEQRPNFRIDGFTAQYLNEDTGIYFSFDMGGDFPMFQLNYARSHVFALEAVDEVRSFMQHFDQIVDDPRIDGMTGGEFSQDKFLAGFDTGNRTGYRMAADPSTGFEGWFTRPAAVIAAEWRWNFGRAAMQERVGESVFVPKISYFLMEGELRSGAVWSDAIPVAMPEVEYLVIVRDRSWPQRLLNREPEILALPFAQLEPIAARYRFVPGELGHYQMYWDKAPADVTDFLRNAAMNETPFEAVSADRILDEETMADVCAVEGLHHKLK